MLRSRDKFIYFVTVKQVQLQTKTLGGPVVEAVGHAETAGFPLFRPSLYGQRSPTRVQFLLNGYRWAFMICFPVASQIYNTDTSTNAIRSGESIFFKGGKGVDLLSLTDTKPFLNPCNYLTLTQISHELKNDNRILEIAT